MESKKFYADCEEAGKRLDVFLVKNLEDISRSKIQKLLQDERVTVNKRIEKASYKIKENDIVEITIPKAVPIKVIPQDIPIDVVYEDKDIIVVNKPKGMVVHPAKGNYTGTLVNALLFHCDDLSGINGFLRPGIVHRLDKDTSGLIVAAKNDTSHLHLASQIKNRNVKKEYYALVHGVFKKESGTICAPIGRHKIDRKKMAVDMSKGRKAVTHYKLLESFEEGYSLLSIKLETGRTHQIRVHMSYLGYPIAGDTLYAPKKKNRFGIREQLLHSKKLGLIHPTSKKYIEFTAPLPSYFEEILNKLRKNDQKV